MFSNWFGGKSKEAVPDITPLQAQRAKQIEQLRATHRNVVEVQRNVEYRVSFTAAGSTLYMNITLPPRFPEDSPHIKIIPSVHHPWVDNLSLLTKCPLLNAFTVTTSLGRVVKDIIDEFQRNPPVVVNQGTAGLSQTTAYAPSHYQTPTTMQQGYMNPPVVPSWPKDAGANTDRSTYPPYPTNDQLWGRSTFTNTQQVLDNNQHFPQLQEMSKEKLEELLRDEDLVDEIVLNLPEVQRIVKSNESLCEVNHLLSRGNLTKKPLLDEKNCLVLEKQEQLCEARREFDEAYQVQTRLHETFTLQSIRDQLRIAAMQAEEESETIAEQFLQGKLSADEFKKVFTEKRMLNHMRKLKEEKIATPGLLQRTV